MILKGLYVWLETFSRPLCVFKAFIYLLNKISYYNKMELNIYNVYFKNQKSYKNIKYVILDDYLFFYHKDIDDALLEIDLLDTRMSIDLFFKNINGKYFVDYIKIFYKGHEIGIWDYDGFSIDFLEQLYHYGARFDNARFNKARDTFEKHLRSRHEKLLEKRLKKEVILDKNFIKYIGKYL